MTKTSNPENPRRIGDVLTSRFGAKWKVGETYTITAARVEASVYNGEDTRVAVFSALEAEPNARGAREIFSGAAVVVKQTDTLLALNEEVFPLIATLVERQSTRSNFRYQELV